ncbi:hypothetical protein I4U23_025853 [Adineta vaga]|nr:hypothetical protein I4U23_025853 [Adineta vaga]
MNLHLEKLCIPRYQRDPIWKFWQTNARLKNIHPPEYWKSFDYYTKRNFPSEQITKNATRDICEDSRETTCHYTTLIYKFPSEKQLNEKGFRVFIDFEHHGLEHTTWKESIEQKQRLYTKTKRSNVKFLQLNVKNKQQSLNEEYLRRQELARYVKLHTEKDNLFALDKTSYPKQSMPMSRRPRDALHIDFYQAPCFEGSKVEATFKTFYHRKYLLNQQFREYTLKDMIKTALNAELNIEIIGHFTLYPNELSKHEIKMFELTSTFGDIYEGHIIKINKDKIVLLLASTYHSNIKLSQVANDPTNIDTKTDQQSTIEQIILDHVREYLRTHHDHLIDQIRRVQIELEPVLDTDKRRIIVHLLTDKEMVENLTFEITQEQEPKLFDDHFQQEFYFLQGNHEKTILHSVEYKLKQLQDKRYSDLQLTLDMEHDIMDSIRKMFHAYTNKIFSTYSREECMRIAIEHHFDDLLDILDLEEHQSVSDEQIQMMIDDIQMRLRLQIERRLKAEETAKILLIGPSIKKTINFPEKQVVVLDHHREIFITRSDFYTGPSKVKNIQRHESGLILHEEIDGGPKSFDRLPMSIDSLTLLTRHQQRKHLADEQYDNNESDHVSLKTLNTTSLNTKSYNKSAHPAKFDRQKQIKRRLSRSPAEYGKHKQKRKRYTRYQLASKALINNRYRKYSFFKNLLLIRRNSKQKRLKTLNNINFNAIKKHLQEIFTDLQKNSISKSTEYLSKKERLVKQQSSSQYINMNMDEKDLIGSRESQESQITQEQLHDEGFQEKDLDDDSYDESKTSIDTERYLKSLYDSLSSVMKQVHQIYESKSSQLLASLDLAHIFITFLHMKKDPAHEIASRIINARQQLVRTQRTQKSSFNNTIHNENDTSNLDIHEEKNLDDTSISSGMISIESSDTTLNGNDSTSRSNSVYETYFHLKWCYDSCIDSNTKSYIEKMFIEEFLKKSINILFHRLQLINSPLLENIALMQTLKKYVTTNLLHALISTEDHPSPIGYNSCIWFSTNILIKTICLLSNDLFDQISHDYLADYTKFEYMLISCFHKIEIVSNLDNVIKKNSSHPIPDARCLLHVIDLNQAPKFFSDHAFKRFQLSEEGQLNNNIEALKDLVLLDIQKRNVKSKEKLHLPLSINDLIKQQHTRVLSPSPWIVAQFERRWKTQKLSFDEYREEKDLYRFDETTSSGKVDNLPIEVRTMLIDMIRKYGTVEENVTMEITQDGLSEEDVAQLVENAIAAVERFDRENNIGERKLQNKKTINDRLTEFFKYSGRHGVRLLDDVLKIAKLRSNDPKKYIPLAVNILKDRLKQYGSPQHSKQTVRFAHTLETLLTATNDEPELITTILKKNVEEKKSADDHLIHKNSSQLIFEDSRPDLSVAQLIILSTLSNQTPLKLTSMQIEQICLKQNLSMEPTHLYLEKLIQTTEVTDRFQLTEEQLIQIAFEENIQIAEVHVDETSDDNIYLTESQIQSLIAQIDVINESLLISARHEAKQDQHLPLVLHLHQFIELCSQQRISMERLLHNESTLQNSSPSFFVDSKFKLNLSNLQMAYLIKKNQFDINKLSAMQQHMGAQTFRLNTSQLAYLFHNHRTIQNHTIGGLSASQLIALHMLYPSFFVLTYQQIEQLALIQNMPLEHFRTLFPSQEPFELSHKQLLQMAMENKIVPTEILSRDFVQKSILLDLAQLCSLISQNDLLLFLQNSINPIQSMEESNQRFQRIYLNVSQILSLSYHSNIDFNQRDDFRLEPEQFATLWKHSNISFDDLEHNTVVPDSQTQFTLTDEQFSSLLSSVSISDSRMPVKSITTKDIHLKVTSSEHSTESNESIINKSMVSDAQNQPSISFPEQLKAINERLQSSLRAHTEAVKVVSDSLVKYNRIENALNLIHDISLHSLDDVSTKETETIPSFVLDLLKMNTMTENMYKSIQQSEITTDDLNKMITMQQLSFSQIHKIQTQLLTPKLIDKLQSGQLSQQILDAYKSQSPLQIIKNVRSLAVQLDSLSFQQLPTISQLDSSIVSIKQQTTSSKDDVQESNDAMLDEKKRPDSIVLHFESVTNRQQILQELSERLDTQLLELNKEYGIEPTKGQSSIRQITEKLRKMPIADDIEDLIGRQIDEVDILNIFNGHTNNLFDSSTLNMTKTNELIERNIQHRFNRINERIHIIHLWQNYIENNRLKRSMNLDEYTAIVFENVAQFEQLTNLHLTEDDLHVISMNRFTSLERVMNRHLTESEYRRLLLTNTSFEYIEKELLGRSMTIDERTEQEELAFLPYQEVFSITLGNVWESLQQQNITPNYAQLEEILRRRAELVDQYEIMHSISPSIKFIEKQFDRQLTFDEKKCLVHDDYSIIKQLKDEEHPRATASILQLIPNTQKRNLIENIEQFQTQLARSLTKEEIRMIANGDLIELEKQLDTTIPRDTIKSLYNDRFTDLTNELNRDLTENEIRNILNGQFNDIEEELSRRLTSTERQAYKSFDTKMPSSTETREDSEDDLFIFNYISKQTFRFTLTEIEKAIGKHLTSDQLRQFAGPHMIDIPSIERTLNRALTFDELTNLTNEHFDEIRRILQRYLTQEELLDLLNGRYQNMIETIRKQLEKQKEEELKQLPIKRLQYFENILQRQLTSDELLRFAEDRFKPILNLLTYPMKSEQLRDIASGHYDKIEEYLKRSLTSEEKYQLQKSILQVHVKYANVLDELEYMIQRKLNTQELRALFAEQYDKIEMRLGRSLTEEQLRNILSGKYDDSLVEIEDLLKRLRRRYEDNDQRTRNITARLIEQLDQHKLNVTSIDSAVSRQVISAQKTGSNIDLSEEEHQLLMDKNIPTDSNEPMKAFETPTRLVEHIADKERLENFSTIVNTIDNFQKKSPGKNIAERSSSNQTTLAWLSNLTNDLASQQLPAIKSNDNKSKISQQHSLLPRTDDDLYLGWTLFKSASYPDLGLREEKPLMINVKHRAQTYVVGIPEEYADEKSKTMANKIYRGESIFDQLSTSQLVKRMREFVSQLFHIPIINDATHFIVPSRAYDDIIEPLNTYQSEIIDIENDDLQMCDSPETLEWYEECIQRNVQVHAQIPNSYQPSIVYCHTGRRSIITPAKRVEYRNMSIFNQTESIVSNTDKTTFDHDFLERFSESIFDDQSRESPSTTQTVTDLIMHTVASSQKTDLLEALEDLFSQENLDKYPMTETHWQDIFLILLNSYLHSTSSNRKDIFKRLTDKLNELRRKERRRSSGLYPSIAIASPANISTTTINELSDSEQKQFHFGLNSPFTNRQNDRSPNDSEISSTPLTSGQQSVASHDTLPLLSNKASSTQSFSQNQSIGFIIHKTSVYSQTDITKFPFRSAKQIAERSPHIRQNQSTNDKYQRPTTAKKPRRYKITIVHSDELSCSSSNQCETRTEPLKLPPISSKNKSFQRPSFTTNKRI